MRATKSRQADHVAKINPKKYPLRGRQNVHVFTYNFVFFLVVQGQKNLKKRVLFVEKDGFCACFAIWRRKKGSFFAYFCAEDSCKKDLHREVTGTPPEKAATPGAHYASRGATGPPRGALPC